MSERDGNSETKYRTSSPIAASFRDAFSVAFRQLDAVYRGFRMDGVLVAALTGGGLLDT